MHRFCKWRILKWDESDGDPKFIATLDLEANWQVIEKQIKDNLENGEEYAWLIETPYRNLMLDRWVLRTKERHARHNHFYHKRWYGVKYGLGVFREGIITNNDLHEERFNRLLTQMNGCNILLSYNMWFKVEEIKME